MENDCILDGLALIDRLFSSTAYQRIDFHRDASDSYAIEIRPGEIGRAKLITKEEVLPLLPTGSRWDFALGWRSFLGLPFRWNSQLWLVLGMEGVLAHPTRGAYPVFRGYIFPFQSLPESELIQLAQELVHGKTQLLSSDTSAMDKGAYEVVAAKSRTPQDHERFEGWIIRRAVGSYRIGTRLLFRTLVLSEDQLAPLTLRFRIRDWFTGRRSPIDCSEVLVATIPSIRSRFPLGTRAWLTAFGR